MWFADQNNRPLQIENNMNITFIIRIGSIKMRYSLEPMYRKYMFKDIAFCYLRESLAINMVKNYWILQQKLE